MNCARSVSLAVLAVLLSACGGGGGDSPRSTAANTSFPLRAAYEAYARSGQTYTYNIEGTCGGWATQTDSPAVAGTFNGQPAMVKTSTLRMDLDVCNSTFAGLVPAGLSVAVSQTFFDMQMRPIAIAVAGSGQLTTAPVVIPGSVLINDAGVLASGNAMTVSFSVLPDTETTAFVPVTYQIHGASGSQVGMDIQTFRISTDGKMQIVKNELRLANGALLVLSPR